MIVVSSALIGETVTITLLIYDAADNLTDPDEWNGDPAIMPTITIRKGETKFVANIIDEADTTRVSLGEYEYKWDTAGLKPGPYTLTGYSVVDGDVRTPQKTFTLKDSGT